MPDLLNPEPFSLATAEPYVPWSPFPEWAGGLQPAINLGMMLTGNAYGTANFGFMRQGNLYNNMQQQAWLTRINSAIQTSAASDTGTITEGLRGWAALNNVRWDRDMENAARNWASWGSGVMAPVMLQSEMGTQIYDATFGGGRSQAVLTKYAMLSGQFMDDPLGRGLSRYSDTAGDLTGKMLYDRLYGGPPEMQQGLNRWRRTAGLTSGETGNLLQEMTMRGQISPMSSMAGGTDMEMASANVDNIKRALDSRFKAVEAMKEIFGSAGQPNAPMRKLLDALEAFTGGTQQISLADNPQKLEMIVRNLHNAANIAGIPMQAVSALMQNTSQSLSAAGLNQAFTPQIMQDQLIQRAALQRTGVMSTPAWGLYNVDQLSQLRNVQMQGATGSEFANFLGAAARLSASGNLDTSTPEGQMMQRVLQQASTGTLGAEGMRLASGDVTQFGQILQRAFGVSASGVTAELSSRHANSEFVYKGGMHRAIVNEGQPLELGRRLGFTSTGMAFATASAELTELVRRSGGRLKMDSVAGLSAAMGERVWEALSNMDNATLQDTGKRNAAMATAMRDALAAEGGDVAAAILADPKGEQMLRTLGERMFNQADLVARGPGGRGPGLLNMLVGNTPQMRAAREKLDRLTKVTGFLQSESAGLGKDNPMLRFVDSLISVGYDPASGDLGKITKETLGFKDSSEQAVILKTNIDKIARARADLQKQLEGVGLGEGEELSEEAKAEAQKRIGALSTAMADMEKALENNPALKAAYDKLKEDMSKREEEARKAASGEQDAAMTFQIGTLNINGSPVATDGKGETKGTAKSADGRGKGEVP